MAASLRSVGGAQQLYADSERPTMLQLATELATGTRARTSTKCG